MNNTTVEQELDSCIIELQSISTHIISQGFTYFSTPYLSKYAIIKACGTIESSYKSLIVDRFSRNSTTQISSYLNSQIKMNSSNPSFTKICELLNKFDPQWAQIFKTSVSSQTPTGKLTSSLTSLVSARNEFAHGGNPHVSITNVITYFVDSRTILEILDSTIG